MVKHPIVLKKYIYEYVAKGMVKSKSKGFTVVVILFFGCHHVIWYSIWWLVGCLYCQNNGVIGIIKFVLYSVYKIGSI